MLWVDGGQEAVFAGDLLRSPVQVLRPDDPCSFDLDREQARRSRRQVLAAARRGGATVFPAHLPGSGGFVLGADPAAPDGRGIDHWTPLREI